MKHLTIALAAITCGCAAYLVYREIKRDKGNEPHKMPSEYMAANGQPQSLKAMQPTHPAMPARA